MYSVKLGHIDKKQSTIELAMTPSLKWLALGLCVFVYVECNCPNGWVTHGTMCYFFSHDSEDWPGALTMCNLVGGSLVEIETGQEGHYLSAQAQLYSGDYWIALTDVLEEGSWVWSNTKISLRGSNYTHWAKGQPDNAHHDQNCAYINGHATTTTHNGHTTTHPASGAWADGACHGAMRYICEKSAVSGAEIIG